MIKSTFEQKDVVYSSLEVTKPEGKNSFQVSWGVNGFGFGLFYFYMDEDKIKCDTETLSRKSLKLIMDKFLNCVEFKNGREKNLTSISDLEIIAIEKGENDWRMECSNTTKDKFSLFFNKMIDECEIV